MKKIITILLFIPFVASAQKTKKVATVKPVVKTEANVGVHFQHKVTDWDALISQAKKEGKFIFIDCYTTWCGPCKYVSSKVFPMKNVGDFYNKNFVCVGLQMDETKKDNADVIATREVAKKIENNYNINVYPSFLIFDNTGKLVHKFVGAGDDKMMIENARNGLSSETQYFSLIEKFKAGEKNTSLITQLCKAAGKAGENAEEYVKAFVEMQKDLFTKENAQILKDNITKTNGIAFQKLFENKEKWQAITDKFELEETLIYSIEDEVYETIQDEKFDKNWKPVEEKMREKYQTLGDIAVTKVQVMFSVRNEDKDGFEAAVKKVITNYPNAFSSAGELNELAWTIFENSYDKDLLKQGLEWSKKCIEKTKEAALIDTYANLLYKLGNVKEAIAAETEALKLAATSEDKKSFQQTIAKMKKGEKTWK